MRKVLVAPLSICLAILILASAVLTVSCGDRGNNGPGSADNSAGAVDNATTENATLDNDGATDNGSPTNGADNLTQKYLFEVSYINWAWGYQDDGIYIDRDGRIYSYDLSHRNPRFQHPEDRMYTRALLDDKYSSNRVLVGTVDQETLARMTALVGPASQGQLTDRENTCYDAGGTAFNAFLFDPETGVYRTVLLRQCGDWSRRNTAPEAATLFDWLEQLRGGSTCCY